MSPFIDERTFQQLLLTQLIPPELDARIERDPVKLDNLKTSILRFGVIKPLAVMPAGDRYEIVDGHRRYLAATLAGLIRVPCMVYTSRDAALEGVKYQANVHHEDMSPADEAVYFHGLFLGECHEDIEAVAALVGRSVPYVDSRLQLLLGAPEIFEAVKAREIGLGVAEELNKIPVEEFRKFFLGHAIRGKSPKSVVAGWVQDWQQTHGVAPTSPASPPVAAESVPAGHYDPNRCYLCRTSDPRFIPELVSIHTHCRLALLDPMLAASRGES